MPNPAETSAPVGTIPAYPPELADIIERVESSNFLASIRFEPGVHEGRVFGSLLMQRCRAANNCNIATARVLLSMSYGLYQIMGFNLYHPKTCDYVGSVGEFLVNKAYQRQMLTAFLRANGIAYSAHEMLEQTKRDNFARRYNGAGNVAEYSAKILTAAHALGVK